MQCRWAKVQVGQRVSFTTARHRWISCFINKSSFYSGAGSICAAVHLQSGMSHCLFFNPHLLFHKRASTSDICSANWGRVTRRMLTAAEDRLEDSRSTRPSCHSSSLLDVPGITGWLLTAIPHSGEKSSTCTACFKSANQAQLKCSRETVFKHGHRMRLLY